MNKGILILSLLFLVLATNLIYAEEAQALTAQDIQTTTNNFLSQQINVPQNLQILAKGIFGLKSDNNIEFSVFIVLIALLIGIFLIIKKVVGFIPIFEESWIDWAVSIIITLLISVTGSIRDAATWLFGLGEIFKNQTLLNLIFVIIVLAIVIFGVIILLGLLGKSTKKVARRQTGFKVGARID